MPELDATTLKRLASASGFPRVTIQTPMVRGGAEVRQNRIHLKNAVAEAAERLEGLGMSSRDAASLLEPIARLASDDDAMEHQSESRSLFVDESGYESIQLPMELASRVEVGSRFSIAPLVEPAINNAEYAVLALSLGGVGLYRCTRFTAEEIDLDGLPEDLCYVLRFDEFEKSGHVHTTSARGDSMHHGHGIGKDEHDAFVKRFVDEIRPVVRSRLERWRVPLVVVGMEDAVGRFLADNDYAEAASEHRFVDPHTLSLDDLIRLGWECMEPRFRTARDAAIDRFRAADHRAVDIYGVLPALVEGRAETLFVDPMQQIRGVFDAATESVHVDPDPAHVTENLIDTALARALELQTQIVVVDGRIDTPAAILH